ncbi:MAG: branched-chain amino acid ABC transporter ATP-binding protein [Kaistia sp. SCN 65-12]|uniref:ABC transporter ATP-binding protein n=1 Tax=Hyphomicrobium sp. CS1BSMeth3 TaxID=1892844 RepID=UPI0008695C3B|nr:ABC transporter ATP-binding protein [Hyphomicrobium sp. CS1BSMeth3]ODT22622.1 MAG: branched-chain amino acid ABC transporter ATP-binding protein [Kaistia sp. SCN 65-12]
MLELQSVHAGYDGIEVLSNVSLSVGDGDYVTLLGANNAGKSTLVNCISGLVRPTNGRIIYKGSDLVGVPPHEITSMGICQVPEGRQLFPSMTVLENLLMGGIAPNARSRRPERLEFVFELFPRLAERRKQQAGTLSGGEQQMAAIGRALIGGPTLLVLDEPSLGLSPLFVKAIFEALRGLHQGGLSILLVEQNLSVALRHAQRGYVLERGEIVLAGNNAKLRDDPHVRRAYLGL